MKKIFSSGIFYLGLCYFFLVLYLFLDKMTNYHDLNFLDHIAKGALKTDLIVLFVPILNLLAVIMSFGSLIYKKMIRLNSIVLFISLATLVTYIIFLYQIFNVMSLPSATF